MGVLAAPIIGDLGFRVCGDLGFGLVARVTGLVSRSE